VLFSGGSDLQDRVVAAIASAPADRAAYDVVVEGMAAGGEALEERRDYARQRAAAIAANPSLQERELLKLSALSAAAATALAERGLPAPVAALVAETGVAVFKVAFERWVGAPDTPPLARCVSDAADQLRAVAGGAPG